MLCVELGKIELDLEKLDKVINNCVPAGRNIREHKLIDYEGINELNCLRELKEVKKFNRAIGTLGGGNHFIEIDVDDEENKYLVIHTGSRNLGKQVADYYQNLAIELCSGKEEMFNRKEEIIRTYKAQGRKQDIQKALKDLEKEYKDSRPNLPEELCYLEGKYREMYLHDMKICQEYASLNRKYICREILNKLLGLNSYTLVDIKEMDIDKARKANVSTSIPFFETIHNYICFEDNIVRKGAIRANKDELVIIPINMRDGSIIAEGKGNDDWNQSAPHGAGRIMSRMKAKKIFNLEEFKESMKGVYTTSVVEETIDEAPFVYKPMQEIIDNIQDTVEIVKIIKPIYNFKAKS